MSAPLAFIDTETTSLRPDRRVWEVGLIVRSESGEDDEYHWFIHMTDLDLGNADPFALSIGRFYERHPQAGRDMFTCGDGWDSEPEVMGEIGRLTRGAHLVGAVVSFDADVLGQRMRDNGILPGWHYHLVDVEALAAGFLAGSFSACQSVGDPDADGPTQEEAMTAIPPWKSEALSRAVGVDPEDFERHSALGDAKWARAIYDAVMGGPS